MLSSDTYKRLVIALTDANAASDVQASILARSAIKKDTKFRLDTALTSDGLSGQAFGDEVSKAIASGAALSKEAKRRILIALTSQSAGNELINAIQSSSTSPIVL